MSTDISVKRKTHPSTSRSWLTSSHGTEPGTNPSITLDLALFRLFQPCLLPDLRQLHRRDR